MKKGLQKCMITFLLLVAACPVFAQEFENGEIGITLNSWGRVRVYSPAIVEGNQQIDRFSILVGGNENQVFDYGKDAETEDTLRTVETPTMSDVEMYVSVDNSYPSTLDPPEENMPPAVLLKVNVYGWNSGAYALLKYTLTNLESTAMSYKVGYEILPQIDGAYGFESVGYNSAEKAILIKKSNFSTKVLIRSLSKNLETFSGNGWFDGYNGSDTTLYSWLYADILVPNFTSDDNGSVGVGGLAISSFEPNETKEYWFAVAAGKPDASSALAEAVQKYEDIITDVKEINEFPATFKLSQNYPNPFNPNTKINYQISKASDVELKVFDLLGREVAVLADGNRNQGSYSVNFDASNLPSGVYIYQLKAENKVATKKMILIK